MQVNTYPYFDEAAGGLRFAAMLDALDGLPPGSVVLLHPCCHNPTGTDLTAEQWRATLAVLQRRKLLPLFDISPIRASATGWRRMALRCAKR